MRRNDALIPLTHDHHHALAQARRLALASASTTDERKDAASLFVDFYSRDTLVHFREEEETVFPLVVDRKEAEGPLKRLMMDHLRIHGCVRRLTAELAEGDAQPNTMKVLSELLEKHIRFEEKSFFPMVEDLAGSDLVSIELAPRDRTVSGR
jgi:hemerythrin-like domain-containing protein